MRSFHHAGSILLSPDGVALLSTFSKLSERMKRSCTGWLAHCVNRRVRLSTAPTSIVLSLAQLKRHGGCALASAAAIATTVWVPRVAGQVHWAGCWAPDAAALDGVCIRPTASGIE